MPTKRGMVLVKKDQIDACITAIETRQLRAGPPKQAGIWDMYDKALAALEAQTAMHVQEGIAYIPIKGAISLDDPFAAFFGETTIKAIEENFDKAIDDPAVHSIVLNVNSPGGYVAGVEALADKIYAGRKKKNIYAMTASLAASAAYWLASAAHKVFVASETSEVGSIGVYMVHFDYSGLLSDMGIKVTEITAGEFKGLGSPYAELSEEDKKLLTADANFVYTRFVETVARNRGISAKEVLKSANGLTFFGSDAVSRGLADGIATSQEVTAMTKEEQDKKDADEAAAVEAAKVEAGKKAEAERIAKIEAENVSLRAEVAASKEKEAAAAKVGIEAEAVAAYKGAFGREATKEEVAHYVALTEDGRKLHKANLKETADNREKLVAKAGLLSETAADGTSDNPDPANSPLVKAGKALGLIAVVK